MFIRILTALIGVVVFFLVLLAPPAVFGIAVCAVIAVMLLELYGVQKCGKGIDAAGVISAIVVAAGAFTDKTEPAIIIAVMVYLFAVIFSHTKKKFSDIMAHGFTTVFITLFMCCISKLYTEKGMLAVLWIFIIAWLTDTGAYFAGVSFGKHKLVPHISPKKTVEGAVGGVVLCTLGCIIYTSIYAALNDISAVSQDYLIFFGIGVIGSVLSQFGDFAASCIKRDMDTKDYGSILPGHGGVMDRFDSVVFVAPFVYYVLKIIL